MKVVALAGGVGGAKLAHGLAMVLAPMDLTVVVNTGDDFEHLGLHISPDLDTVMYALAGVANPETGWGIAGDTFEALGALERLGAPSWFRLGDRDLATHIERTHRLRQDQTLTQVTQALCTKLGIRHQVLPMSDDPVRTKVETEMGVLDFQDYFVRRRCEPTLRALLFSGATEALPAPGVTEAIETADVVVICPSNPFVSITPILSVPNIRESVLEAQARIAVSPIVGGEAVKGPAAKMMVELGLDSSAPAVSAFYEDLLTGFVLDEVDADLELTVRRQGVKALVTNTMMRTDADRRALAEGVLAFAQRHGAV
jgi:LPPG:FO 2-phospho-L-lactate transferase